MAVKKYAVVDQDRCVACGACKPKCPRGAIKIWKGCYAEVDTDLCVGCGMCTRVCPVGCLSLVERKEAENE